MGLRREPERHGRVASRSQHRIINVDDAATTLPTDSEAEPSDTPWLGIRKDAVRLAFPAEGGEPMRHVLAYCHSQVAKLARTLWGPNGGTVGVLACRYREPCEPASCVHICREKRRSRKMGTRHNNAYRT